MLVVPTRFPPPGLLRQPGSAAWRRPCDGPSHQGPSPLFGPVRSFRPVVERVATSWLAAGRGARETDARFSCRRSWPPAGAAARRCAGRVRLRRSRRRGPRARCRGDVRRGRRPADGTTRSPRSPRSSSAAVASTDAEAMGQRSHLASNVANVPGPDLVPIRDDLRAMEGYHSAQVDVEVRLNTNESPFPPPAGWREELAAALAVDRVAPLPRPFGGRAAGGDRRVARRRPGPGVRGQRLERGAADAAADVRRCRAVRCSRSSRRTSCTPTSPASRGRPSSRCRATTGSG